MDKKIPIIIVCILIVICVGMLFLVLNPADKSALDDTRTINTTESTTTSPKTGVSSQPSNEGTYVEYSSDVISNTSGTKLLFFHAPWCPQCRALENDIKTKGAPAGVTIIKVDYDSSQSLRQEYGVTIQTTVVHVDDQGMLINKFVAYDDPSVAAVKENLLK